MALRLKIAQMHAAFAPPPEIIDQLGAKGFKWAPSSRGSGQWININRAENPEPGATAYNSEGDPIGVWDAKGKISRDPRRKEPSAFDKQIEEANKPSVTPPQPGILDRIKTAFGGAPAAVQIKTAEEYDALASGQVFISPDGSTRKKP